MTEKHTDYGRLFVGDKAELFAKTIELATAGHARAGARFSWGLTGGSTPLEWYKWCVETRALSPALVGTTDFTVSDERHVPLASNQSNFGNADRLLFAPLGVPPAHRHAWPVELEPVAAAAEYERSWRAVAGPNRAYDVCFLGMGDDAHTASFFPGSPLLQNDRGMLFGAVDAGQKGWRLTITPSGLRACGLVVVMTLGAAKAPALKRIMRGNYNPSEAPAQILKGCADRVIWLVDAAAAAGL